MCSLSADYELLDIKIIYQCFENNPVADVIIDVRSLDQDFEWCFKEFNKSKPSTRVYEDQLIIIGQSKPHWSNADTNLLHHYIFVLIKTQTLNEDEVMAVQ